MRRPKDRSHWGEGAFTFKTVTKTPLPTDRDKHLAALAVLIARHFGGVTSQADEAFLDELASMAWKGEE